MTAAAIMHELGRRPNRLSPIEVAVMSRTRAALDAHPALARWFQAHMPSIVLVDAIPQELSGNPNADGLYMDHERTMLLQAGADDLERVFIHELAHCVHHTERYDLDPIVRRAFDATKASPDLARAAGRTVMRDRFEFFACSMEAHFCDPPAMLASCPPALAMVQRALRIVDRASDLVLEDNAGSFIIEEAS